MKDNQITAYESKKPIIPKSNSRPNSSVPQRGGIFSALADAFMSKEAFLREQAKRKNQLDISFRYFSDMAQSYWNSSCNIIIAGGTQYDRFCAERYFIENAVVNKFPAILVHTGNEHVVNRYKVSARLPGSVYGNYAPLAGFPPHIVANILTDLGIRLLRLQNLMGLWSLVTELIYFKSNRITVDSLINFPYYDFYSYIENPENNVPQERIVEFTNRYGSIATQANDAQAIVYQLRSLPLPSVEGVKRYAITSIIEHKGMACIDLVSNSNIFYQELCFAEIDQVQREGKSFYLIVDGIKMLGEDGSISDRLVKQKNVKNPIVICTDDLLALTNGKKDIFNTITGGSNVDVLVFQHYSEPSAEPWSEYFGKKYHVVVNENQSKTKQSFNPFGGSNACSLTTSEDLRVNIMPSIFTALEETQAISRTAIDNQLHYVILDE